MPLVLAGATSGSTTIQATDAVTQTITLPNATGTVALTSTVASTAFRSRFLESGTTYTPATNVKSFYVFVFGSTGGQAAVANSGGIGGSGYSEKYYSNASGTYTYSIGAGGVAGTAGGTTTFDVISVTGSSPSTSSTGSAGGVGSGGDFNATGGTGGNGATGGGGGGGGGAATRAGNGGNGGNAVANVSAGAGGGTGGNNASGATPGAAATTKAAGALDLYQTLGIDIMTWVGGGAPTAGANQYGGTGAAHTQTSNVPFLWITTVGNAGGSFGGNLNSAFSGNGRSRGIIIIELF